MASFEALEPPKGDAVVAEESVVDYVKAMRDLLSLQVVVPTVGGKVVEPLSEARLLRFLRAKKFNVAAAVELYGRYIEYRVATFGVGKLEGQKSRFLRRLPKGCDDASGRPRLLLDLAEVDLTASHRQSWDAKPLIEAIWREVDALLESKDAQALGLILSVDARKAGPKRHMRPARLREILAGIVDRLPARVAAIEVIGAPRWFRSAWVGLGPLLKSKIVGRASLYSLEEASVAMPTVLRHFPGFDPTSPVRNPVGPASPGRVFPADAPESSPLYNDDDDDCGDDSRRSDGSTTTTTTARDQQCSSKKKNKAAKDKVGPASPGRVFPTDESDDSVHADDSPRAMLAEPAALSSSSSSSSREKNGDSSAPVIPAPAAAVVPRSRILAIQEECDARDVEIPDRIELWEEDDIVVYFATEGAVKPVLPKRRPSRRRSSRPDLGRQYYT